jgi:hypothetical protein
MSTLTQQQSRTSDSNGTMRAAVFEGPVEPFVYGIGDKQILTTLCPGGKERMRTLMDLFGSQRDGVVRVAITP